MEIEHFKDNFTEITFTYMPAWEMFLSMHVLANPEHHGNRRKWTMEKETEFPELVGKIRDLQELTNAWLIILDAPFWSEIRQMEIADILAILRKKNIYQWNEMFKYAKKTMSIPERDKILHVLEEYYHDVFRKEELILRPCFRQILKREAQQCKEKGLEVWGKNIHSRLKIEEDKVIYTKNKEYQFTKSEIDTIFVTVSSFIDPHLGMCNNGRELEIVKRLAMEEMEKEIPADFLLCFKALGDSTRLKIVKYLLNSINTTQKLAESLEISEAAVSKHLKILKEAGWVKKKKKGYYVEYEFLTEKIDYLPYLFYETMRI